MDSTSETLHIRDVKPGMMITGIVEQNGPVKIRKVGLVKSVDMVNGLKEMGVVQVTVDPAQQLDIEPAAAPLSQTQKLLYGDSAQASKADQNLSEQFNRSLFLPSVQGLPSAWQYYARQVAACALVLSGGFAVGWTLATVEYWLPAFTSPAKTADTVPIQQSTQPATEQQRLPPAAVASAPESAPKVKEQSKAVPVKTQQDESETTGQERVLGYIPPEEATPAPPSAAQVNTISPELMRKFEQAVADLEQNPQDTRPQSEAPPDIPAVHQLPAWVLTELPSMAFSTHMYASQPQNRWLRVNGRQMREGDWIDDKVQILRIEPQHVIMTYKGHEFSMGALTDW